MTKHYKKDYIGIRVKFLGATNYKSARIKLIDERFSQSKTINYKHTGGYILDQAIDCLVENGYNIVGYSEMKNEYIVFCDNWGTIVPTGELTACG